MKLEVRLFGGFEVRVDGQAVDARAWPRRKPQQLVKLLALEPTHRLHRERIADALWPALAAEPALNQLSKAVSQARRVFEPGIGLRAKSRFLFSDRQEIALQSPDGVWVDAHEFRRLARQALRDRDLLAAREALDLYRGELLPADLYEEWAAQPRESLALLRTDLLMKVATWEAEEGDDARASAALEELLLAEPAREEAHRLLMRLYARAGEVERARRQFEVCRAALERELDTTPEPATDALYAEVATMAPRSTAPVVMPAPPARAQVGEVAPVDATPLSRVLTRPYFGRPSRRALAATAATVIAIGAVLGPYLPGYARTRRRLARAVTAAEMRLAEWRGESPRLVALAGRLDRPGARLDVAESESGWAAVADETGRFVLPDVMWYPEAVYRIVVTDRSGDVRRISIRAPARAPSSDVVDVGDLPLDGAQPADERDLSGLNSIHRVGYDSANADFYAGMVVALTAGRREHRERVDALARYVASLYRPGVGPFDDALPRTVLERGSAFSRDLSSALATLAKAAGYDARLINVVGPNPKRQFESLMIVEVSYGGSWHVYEPTFGVSFEENGRVPSYEQLRLSPGLVARALAPGTPRYGSREREPWLESAFLSGIHHYYWLDARQPMV